MAIERRRLYLGFIPWFSEKFVGGKATVGRVELIADPPGGGGSAHDLWGRWKKDKKLPVGGSVTFYEPFLWILPAWVRLVGK